MRSCLIERSMHCNERSESAEDNVRPTHDPKVICYHQTIYLHEETYIPVLPLLHQDSGLTHLIIAAIHLNGPPGNVTINNHPYWHPRYDILWTDTKILQNHGIKVLGMLGGAHKGTYAALDGDAERFEAYYRPLQQQMIRTLKFDGLDLDVEEPMSLAGIIRLIDRLKNDFGPSFIITLTPVAQALMVNGNDPKNNLSGFSYFALEKAFGRHIEWYNTQFYCGWGNVATTADFEAIVAAGWDPSRVVMGVVTNPANCRGYVGDEVLCGVLRDLRVRFGCIGGVMGWEYFNAVVDGQAVGRPWMWARAMAEAFELRTGRSLLDGKKEKDRKITVNLGS